MQFKTKHIIGFDPLIIKIWSFIHRKKLWNDKTKKYMKVLLVKSWNTALVQDGKDRFTIDCSKK